MKRTALSRKTPMAAKPKAKKAKGKPRSFYNKKLDEIAKGFAKERDGYFCQYSGDKVEGSNAHGSHVIPVSAGIALRWDLMNIKCLSYHWHMNFWHKNPLEAADWFQRKFPERWKILNQKRLAMRAIGARKISNPELIEFYNMAAKCQTWEEYDFCYSQTIGRTKGVLHPAS